MNRSQLGYRIPLFCRGGGNDIPFTGNKSTIDSRVRLHHHLPATSSISLHRRALRLCGSQRKAPRCRPAIDDCYNSGMREDGLPTDYSGDWRGWRGQSRKQRVGALPPETRVPHLGHASRIWGSGYKFGRWLDTTLMQLSINGGSHAPVDPESVPEIMFHRGNSAPT